LRALEHWLQQDYRNPNWWWNVIYVPRVLGQIMLLLDDRLSDAQRQTGLAIIARAKLGMTGANLVDVANIVIMRGVLAADAPLLQRAVDAVIGEIKVTTGEGIQPDFSFHQHGALLYSHGYGATFLGNATEMAALMHGTAFALSPEAVDALVAMVLDGSRWMLRYQTGDYGAMGRGITRPASPHAAAGYLRPVIDRLLILAPSRGADLRELRGHLDGDAPLPPHNRAFWRSDFMSHGRPDFYASVRMHSTRLLSNDPPYNNEGYDIHHVADGCMYIMRTGREYHNIFPLWHKQRVPGTTCVQGVPLDNRKVSRTGTRDFVGGVSDGAYGCAAFDFERDGLTARKAWFFFDDVVVCLGAGITAKADLPVDTTINQCWRQGDILAAGASGWQLLDRDGGLPTPVSSVYHDGIVYSFLTDATVRLQAASGSQSWGGINHAFKGEVAEGEVFTLWLEHGRAPRNASYAYTVRPQAHPFDLAALQKLPEPTTVVLTNTPKLQAVHDHTKEVVGLVFYAPGKVAVPGAFTLAVDQPCVLLVRRGAGQFQVAVADPAGRVPAVNVALVTTAGDTAAIRVALPGDGDAGRSIVRAVTPTAPD
jgi:chondroitin AC lyase